jgi:hypothetical protein
MKLTGTVIRIDSGTEYTDGLQRARIKIYTGSGMGNELSVINANGLSLDDEVEVSIVRKVASLVGVQMSDAEVKARVANG